MNKKILVLGASPNPDRYSNRAIKLLKKHKYEVVALGMRKGEVAGISIQQKLDDLSDIHTITMYLGPNNQKGYYQMIQDAEPKRVIFNPGTENDELRSILSNKQIEVVENCTLVMLNYEMF